MKKWIFITLIIFLLGLVALGVVSDKATVISEHLYVSDQAMSNGILIDRVVFDEPGYIVVHAESGGAPGRIVGSSVFFEPGQYSDASVTLEEDLEAGSTLYAMIREDNGDGEFDPRDDDPVVSGADKLIFASFKILEE